MPQASVALYQRKVGSIYCARRRASQSSSSRITNPRQQILVRCGEELPQLTPFGVEANGYFRHKFGVEYALFLSGIGYDQRKIADADAPRNWADAWDLNRYKGVS